MSDRMEITQATTTTIKPSPTKNTSSTGATTPLPNPKNKSEQSTLAIVNNLKSNPELMKFLQDAHPAQKNFSDNDVIDFFLFRLPFSGTEGNNAYQKIVSNLSDGQKENLKNVLDSDMGIATRSTLKNNETDLFEYCKKELSAIMKIDESQVLTKIATMSPNEKILLALNLYKSLNVKYDNVTGDRLYYHHASRLPGGARQGEKSFLIQREKNLPVFNSTGDILKNKSTEAHCIEQCLMLNSVFRFMQLDSKVITAKGAQDQHKPSGLESNVDHYAVVIKGTTNQKIYIDAQYASKVLEESADKKDQLNFIQKAFDYVRAGVTQKESFNPEHNTIELIALTNTNNLKYVFLDTLSDRPISNPSNLLSLVQKAKNQILSQTSSCPNLFQLQDYGALATMAEFKLLTHIKKTDEANNALQAGIKRIDSFLASHPSLSQPEKQLLNFHAFEMEFLLKNSSKEKLTKRAEAIYNARSKTHCQFNFSIVQANNQDLNYYFPSTASMPGKAPKPIVSIYDYSINSIKERCESLLTHSGKNNSQSNLDYTYLIEATGKFKNNLEKRSTIHDSNFKVDANTLETLTKIEHLIGSIDPDKINEKKRTEMRILLDSLK